MLPHRASWHGRKDEYLFLRPTRRRTTDGASVAELLTGDLHAFAVERVENDWHVTLDHPMTKDHFISFVAYVTDDGNRQERRIPRAKDAR